MFRVRLWLKAVDWSIFEASLTADVFRPISISVGEYLNLNYKVCGTQFTANYTISNVEKHPVFSLLWLWSLLTGEVIKASAVQTLSWTLLSVLVLKVLLPPQWCRNKRLFLSSAHTKSSFTYARVTGTVCSGTHGGSDGKSSSWSRSAAPRRAQAVTMQLTSGWILTSIWVSILRTSRRPGSIYQLTFPWYPKHICLSSASSHWSELPHGFQKSKTWASTGFFFFCW